MDPNETLEQIRANVARVLDRQDVGTDHTEAVLLLAAVCGDVRDLDDWLSGGGLLPSDWERQAVRENRRSFAS